MLVRSDNAECGNWVHVHNIRFRMYVVFIDKDAYYEIFNIFKF